MFQTDMKPTSGPESVKFIYMSLNIEKARREMQISHSWIESKGVSSR